MQRRVTGVISAIDVSTIVDQLLEKLHPAKFACLFSSIQTVQVKQTSTAAAFWQTQYAVTGAQLLIASLRCSTKFNLACGI